MTLISASDAASSDNYGGNLRNPDNHSADITHKENTSIYLDRLPPTLDYPQLLAGLRNTGYIKQCHINGPNASNPMSSNAKVVFFTHADAQKVIDLDLNDNLMIAGVRPRTGWNRIRVPEDPAAGRSRSLRIRGPTHLVNQVALEEFWTKASIYWNTKCVQEIGEVGNGDSVVWYTFGSWRCQSAAAKRALEVKYGGAIKIWYRKDPCAPKEFRAPRDSGAPSQAAVLRSRKVLRSGGFLRSL
ncbi:hypothetical protein F5Y18DRAFT_437465 [Xylariaceae sp. FL1019]|nr:hypothetical protein F5Y18DRAFT_437465 [Xylariaceae sp. FL1019]